MAKLVVLFLFGLSQASLDFSTLVKIKNGTATKCLGGNTQECWELNAMGARSKEEAEPISPDLHFTWVGGSSDYHTCQTDIVANNVTCGHTKYFGIGHGRAPGLAVTDFCKLIGAVPWCPETEQESLEIMANLIETETRRKTKVKGAFMNQQNIDTMYFNLLHEVWTGLQLDETLSTTISDNPTHYSCNLTFPANFMLNKTGINHTQVTYPVWNPEHLDSSIFLKDSAAKFVEYNDDDIACIGVGTNYTMKWGHNSCTIPLRYRIQPQTVFGLFKMLLKLHDLQQYIKAPICMTTRDMSVHAEHYSEIDKDAPARVQKVITQIPKIPSNLKKAYIWAIFIGSILFTCCCCCCCCCCFLPCRKNR